jgi:heterodisulfide reductase subunit B
VKLAYYPGCTLKTDAKNFDISTVSAAKVLNIGLVELPRWNCCGTVHALAKDDVMHYLAPIRNLIRVEEMVVEGLVEEKKLVTQCAMCWNTIKRANSAAINDQDRMEKIRGIMEREPEYSGQVEVLHILEVIKSRGWDNVAKSVKKPLDGLRVAPYYGCLLLRPRELALDDPDNPKIIEHLMETLGAETVDIPYKSRCCGAYHTVHLKEVTAELSYRILEQAIMRDVHMIVTACPLCEYNLGKRQKLITKIFPKLKPVPVVYYTQLMALAFGLEEEATCFYQNDPDPRPILKEKGLM